MTVISMYNLIIGTSRISIKLCQQVKMIFHLGENFRDY